MDKTILLVDDDEIFRSRMARALKNRNLNILEASQIEESIQLAKSHDIDWAVIDLRLEQESGLDLIAEINKLKPEIKLLMLTGYGSISTAVEAVQMGAINYLSKPVDADELINAFEGKTPTELDSKAPSLAQVEWEHIQRVLSDHDGNISKASSALGIHRRSLQRKLKQERPS